MNRGGCETAGFTGRLRKTWGDDMEWLEEFDLYMRPVVHGLGRCRFKGGSTTKTERNIPNQTAEERSLQNYLMNYAKGAGDIASYFLGSNVLGNAARNTFTPNWESLYNDVTRRNGNDLDFYNKNMYGALNNYTKTALDAVSQYTGDEDRYLGQYESSMADALGKYNDVLDGQKALWENLVNGELPSAYASNRQAALNADLKGTVGSTINGLASRGIINSGVGNKAMDDISQSASDTLAKAYRDDLAMEASLLNQQGQYAQNRYSTNAGNAGDVYGAQSSSARAKIGNQMNAYNNVWDRYSDAYNKWYDRSIENNNSRLTNAATAQTGSFEPVSNYINYASTLSSPASNLYNTMYSGRMGTGSTSTTQKSGDNGVWSAVGALGAGIVCFTGDTLITTPTGYKCIRDIQEGDTVLSWKDGTVVEKQVSLVMEPREADIVEVYFDNGTVWHTTESQRYFDGRHFCYVTEAGEPAIVHNGKPTEIVRVVKPGRREKVYDFTLYGFSGENVYFANDVAAEGLGD